MLFQEHRRLENARLEAMEKKKRAEERGVADAAAAVAVAKREAAQKVVEQRLAAEAAQKVPLFLPAGQLLLKCSLANHA